MRKLQAFTMVEVLIYTAILSVVASTVTGMILLIYRTQVFVEDRISVNEDMRLLIKSIRDDMYLSQGFLINNDGSISMNAGANGLGTVTYYLSDHQVFRQAGSDPAVALTASSTDIRQFLITDISTPNAAGAIQIDLTIANYPTGTLKPEVERSIQSTISLKYL